VLYFNHIVIAYAGLEKAVEIVMEMLKTIGVQLKPQPPDPVRVLYKKAR
jgi:hypothetical protein